MKVLPEKSVLVSLLYESVRTGGEGGGRLSLIKATSDGMPNGKLYPPPQVQGGSVNLNLLTTHTG